VLRAALRCAALRSAMRFGFGAFNASPPPPRPQEHFFVTPEPNQLKAQINWRISKPKRDFVERSTIQSFVQDEARPAILYNHGNEFLHYEVGVGEWGGGGGGG